MLSELCSLRLAGKISGDGEQFLPSPFIKIRKRTFSQIDRRQGGRLPAQAQWSAQQKLSVGWFMKELVDVRALIGDHGNANELIFERYTAKPAKNAFGNPASVVPFAYVRKVALALWESHAAVQAVSRTGTDAVPKSPAWFWIFFNAVAISCMSCSSPSKTGCGIQTVSQAAR